MSAIYIIESRERFIGAVREKEDADTIAARLRNNGYTAEVHEVRMLGEDYQPSQLTSISANITDDGEVYVTHESTSIDWFNEDRPARWDWSRSTTQKDRYGRLTVSGSDGDRVRELFRAVAEMIRTDKSLRNKARLEGQA